MSGAPLRKCPTCLTPVDEVKLGLRDFRWASDVLPGKVAPMDVDFMLERNGRFLVLEFKPKDMHVGMGQFITLKALEELGMEVWLVKGDGPEVEVSCLEGGQWREDAITTVDQLATSIAAWFQEASEAGRP